MIKALMLDPVLDLKAAASLQTEILAHRGQALEIDASAAQRLGAQCLQVLLSAQRTWSDDAIPLHLVHRSEALTAALELFGASTRFDEPRLDEVNPT